MRITVLIGYFVIISSGVFAQTWVMEYGIASTHPMNDFAGNGYKSGIGQSLSILSKPLVQSFSWQLQFGGNINHFWANNAQGEFYYYVGSENYPSRATYKLKNRHKALSFKTRLSSKPNPVRLFIDLDIGGRNFKTKEVISVNDYDSDARYSKNKISSTNLFLGITGGLLFRMNRYWYLTMYSRFDYGLTNEWTDLQSFTFNGSSSTDLPSVNIPITKTPLLWTGFSMTFFFGGDGSAQKPKQTRSGTYNSSTPNNTTSPTKPSTTIPQRGDEIPPFVLPKIEIPKIEFPQLPKPKPKPKTEVEEPNNPKPSPGPR